MTTLSVAPGCVGVELPNGKKIDADKNGKVIVDDPKVERFALKSGVGQMGAIARTTYNYSSAPGGTRVCTGCSFRGFAWQDTCPRCECEMTEPTEGK